MRKTGLLLALAAGFIACGQSGSESLMGPTYCVCPPYTEHVRAVFDGTVVSATKVRILAISGENVGIAAGDVVDAGTGDAPGAHVLGYVREAEGNGGASGHDQIVIQRDVNADGTVTCDEDPSFDL